VTGLFEGVGIALSSLRAHKLRAALTILGVAIGVTVVMVNSALISGFKKGVSDMLASLGPKTFWVGLLGRAERSGPRGSRSVAETAAHHHGRSEPTRQAAVDRFRGCR